MIKRIDDKEYDFILALNEEEIESLIPMDKKALRFLVDKAELFEVIYADESPVGFMIALREGIEEYDYKSYKWFEERYSGFLYIDRIVIDKAYRGRGFAKRLYQHAFEHAKTDGIGIIAAAINAENKDSLGFHKRMGFCEVGNQLIRGGTIKISQQMKKVDR